MIDNDNKAYIVSSNVFSKRKVKFCECRNNKGTIMITRLEPNKLFFFYLEGK